MNSRWSERSNISLSLGLQQRIKIAQVTMAVTRWIRVLWLMEQSHMYSKHWCREWTIKLWLWIQIDQCHTRANLVHTATESLDMMMAALSGLMTRRKWWSFQTWIIASMMARMRMWNCELIRRARSTTRWIQTSTLWLHSIHMKLVSRSSNITILILSLTKHKLLNPRCLSRDSRLKDGWPSTCNLNPN
jgi:hypothetical protein